MFELALVVQSYVTKAIPECGLDAVCHLSCRHCFLGGLFVCLGFVWLFVLCVCVGGGRGRDLTSLQHASVSEERISSDTCTRCRTEIEALSLGHSILTADHPVLSYNDSVWHCIYIRAKLHGTSTKGAIRAGTAWSDPWIFRTR